MKQGMDSKQLWKIGEEAAKKNQTIYITGHKGLCYDHLGGSFGLAHLLQKAGADAKVCGTFMTDEGFPQNNMLFHEYELEKKIIDPAKIRRTDLLAYVDVYPGNANGYPVKGKTMIVIDHHPISNCKENLDKVPFVDVRNAGSAVALVAEHMKNLNIELTEDDVWLATMMLYGLRVDTKQYKVREKDLDIDFSISPYLSTTADLKRIEEIESKRHPLEIRNAFNKMITNEIGKYSLGVTVLSNREKIPHLADLQTIFEGPAIYIVVAYVNKFKDVKAPDWHFSARSVDSAYNSASVLQEIFGCGGGHWDMAAGYMWSRQIYDLFNVDLTKNESVICQVKTSIEKKLKELSNE